MSFAGGQLHDASDINQESNYNSHSHLLIIFFNEGTVSAFDYKDYPFKTEYGFHFKAASSNLCAHRLRLLESVLTHVSCNRKLGFLTWSIFFVDPGIY